MADRLRLAIGTVVLLLTAVALAAPTGAQTRVIPPAGAERGRLDQTVRYLQNVQNPDGGFPSYAGGPSVEDFSSWVALALAAAGINPQDQAKPGDPSLYRYLTTHTRDFSATTDYERNLLVADAAHTSPHDFGGINLVKNVLARQLADGGFVHTRGEHVVGINDTVFAILSLAPVHGTRAVVNRAVTWLLGHQNRDGSWSSVSPGTGPDADMTGAAIEALNAAGHRHTKQQAAALAFLHTLQNPDGGFTEETGGPSNVASTAWVAQGFWAAGVDPKSWSVDGRNPLDYMASMQQADGAVRYSAAGDANPIWMTAYAGPAFAGQALPIPAVALEVSVKPGATNEKQTTPERTTSATTGDGGTAISGNGGVIADGGGNGAPLFSKPKPQSQGDTPGAIRNTTAATQAGGAQSQGAAGSASGSKAASGRQHLARATATTEPHPGGETGRSVSGKLLSEPAAAPGLKSSAPGLHAAQSGGKSPDWLLIAIVSALIAAFATGIGQDWPRRRGVAHRLAVAAADLERPAGDGSVATTASGS